VGFPPPYADGMISRRGLPAALALILLAALASCTSTPHASPVRAPVGSAPVASAGPSAGDDVPQAGPPAPVPGTVAGRIPAFPPAPAAQRITLPGGPLAPLYKRLPISQPVAFLTIDDGWTQLPNDPVLMGEAHIPFTMFLIAPVAAKNPGFFNQLAAAGGVIEDHTITHPEMKGRPYEFQRHEICDARTSLEHTFGTGMHFFRPPFGDYDQTTLRAVHDCGLKAAFYWSETVNNGTVFYQTAEHQIHPGDIILMHFRPAFTNDVIAALTAIHNAGLTPALLEDYFA
jgi:peptidoglycan/xylan/chitin deacetylase (PgdA/CDA1 family)